MVKWLQNKNFIQVLLKTIRFLYITLDMNITNPINTGVERNDEIRLIYVHLGKITFYPGEKTLFIII